MVPVHEQPAVIEYERVQSVFLDARPLLVVHTPLVNARRPHVPHLRKAVRVGAELGYAESPRIIGVLRQVSRLRLVAAPDVPSQPQPPKLVSVRNDPSHAVRSTAHSRRTGAQYAPRHADSELRRQKGRLAGETLREP
jgi:hypothetical protein